MKSSPRILYLEDELLDAEFVQSARDEEGIVIPKDGKKYLVTD